MKVYSSPPKGGRGIFLLFFLFLLLTPCYVSAKNNKEKKAEKPKQEKLATLYKNARNAIKNLSGQDAARNALIGALARPELNNKQKAKIYYSAAQLEESLNAVENRKAFLKQVYDTANFFNKLLDGLLVGNIQLGHVRIKICVLWVLLLQQLHLVSQLAVAASNQYIHLFKLKSFFLVFLVIVAEHTNEGGNLADGVLGVGRNLLLLQTQHHHAVK